jgi:aldose 1-epimerase
VHVVQLSAGLLEVVLVPPVGGSIARFDRIEGSRRQHLLRPASLDATDPLAMANFPLIPYANRIRGGAFECDGSTVRLRPNLKGDANPLHGQGWLHPWQVERSQARRARLRFHHQPGEWPWDYEAWQDFTLDETGLSITLGCRNLSLRRMPCGLAQHPYFPCDAETVIDTDVTSAWTADADTLPVDRVEATGKYRLSGRKIASADLDNAFDGWSGKAEICWPDAPARVTLSSPDAARFHIYSPVGQPYFAAEPVQNSICALNAPQTEWAGLGIALLEQGETHEMHMRLHVTV